VKLAVSDAREGMQAAIPKVLSGSTWQRCCVHTTRNLLARVPKAQQSRLAALLREAFTAPNAEKSHAAWRAVADAARDTHPKLSEAMDEAESDVLAYMDFPSAHRAKLHSTNGLERLNKEVKRRADVVGVRHALEPMADMPHSRTRLRSSAWSARSDWRPMTSGSCSTATCRLKR
jgi:putative transposase